MDLMTPDIYVIVFFGVFFLGLIAVAIFFLIEQQNILKAIQPQNRLMRPGEVWLQLIPAFGLVWQFIVVIRISESIQREFASWQNDTIIGLPSIQVVDVINTRPTYDIGLAFCILNCCWWIPILGTIASIAGVICWIIYWSRIVEYRKKMERKY